MPTRPGISFWLDCQTPVEFPAVNTDMDVDVAIVGAGIVGLHAAYELRQSGLSVAVYEAWQIGRQATGRSTAKVSSQHGLKYGSLIRDFGLDTAKLYADANQAAITKIVGISSSLPENAGLEDKPAYLYAESAQQLDHIEAEEEAASSLGLPAELLPSAGLPFETYGALRFAGQYQFDPYLYLCGLAQLVAEAGVSVFERSRVVEVEDGPPYRLSVNRSKVTAGKVIVATQMPVAGDGLFFAKAFPFAHPVAAVPLAQDMRIEGMYLSVGNPSHSFRTATRDGKHYLIAAGGEFKIGEQGAASEAIADLLACLKRSFSDDDPTHLWINEDFRPMDGMAFVGPATSGKPDLLVATGFNAWGITQGAVAGDILAARILEKTHPCADLYDTTRVKPVAGGPTFVVENVKTATHLAGERLFGSRISKLEDIAQGEGGVIRHKGEQLAVLKDADGAVTARSAVCTHLGCVVGWNAIDRTWDCSCHGSRFDEDGAVLSGPATAPLEARALAGAKSRS